MKLLIRNLARTTSEDELKALFEVCGTLQSCTIVMDTDTGESKGFGFVEMPKTGEAKIAVKTLNGKEIGGSVIRVKKAQTPHDGKPEKPTKAEKLVKPKHTSTQNRKKDSRPYKKPDTKKSSAGRSTASKSPNQNIWGKK